MMKTVYFLGAGASAADGLPVTGELNFGVASWLSKRRRKAVELRTYLEDIYGVSDSDLKEAGSAWRAFIGDRRKTLPTRHGLPGLIENLTLLDVCINEEQSLGMSSQRKSPAGSLVEMGPTFLRRVRQQLTTAVAETVQDATYHHASPLTHSFVGALGPDDSIVTTNWDMLLDRCLVAAWKKNDNRRLRESPIRYHCVGERPVDWRGNDLKAVSSGARSLLRLHGALNWFGCACCGTVYVNLEGSYVMNEQQRREYYDECHCGAGLLNVMIAPSYLKDYRNLSLRSVWREAQKRLEAADRWVFIGYSLPSDDFHIRAMLMRALRSRITHCHPNRKAVQIEAYLGADSDAAAHRFQDLFRIAPPKIESSGFLGWARSMSAMPA